jgi:hypothetical protein
VISLDEVAAFAGGLPEVSEGVRWGTRTWKVRDKVFAWERPLSKADVRRFGSDPLPDGDLVAVSTADLSDKEAVLASGHAGVFTIEHFAAYPAVLMQLSRVHKRVARELLTDAWRAQAPAALLP